MSHKNRFHVFVVCLTILGLLFNSGNMRVSASQTNLSATSTPTNSAPPKSPVTPIPTSTPRVQTKAEPEAWLDGSIDPEQFRPTDALIIQFNTPMSPTSSPNPVLSWPAVTGVTSWNDTRTILTFKPTAALESKKIYTFFLDSALQSAEGTVVKNRPEWTVRVQSGLKVLSVSPRSGSLDRRYPVIEIHFDRKMKTSVLQQMMSIEPGIDFHLKWKTDRVLMILLDKPLEFNKRYDFTLRGGNDNNSLFADDDTYLAEDYRWFYWQEPFEVITEMLGPATLAVKFNYAVDQNRSGRPFSISPALDGEWKWISDWEIRFTATEPIPALQKFMLSLVRPLKDSNGFETSTLPLLSFSGLAPVRLISPNLVKTEYEDNLITDLDIHEIRIEFGIPVDRVSVENAFSLTPALPGKFTWEKTANGSKETLIYTFKELLKHSTLYELKIDSTVQDTRGKQIMLHPYLQSLKTTDWGGYPSVSFGESGSNIQVVDVNGPRRIQFGGQREGTTFEAYRFDLIDFARLYADHYRYRRNMHNVRDIPISAELESAATWRNIVDREFGDGSITETILPTDLDAGFYVINMRQNNILYDQLFVVIASNTLVVKENGDELFVWLTDINGENIPDAEVRVYSSRGEKVREGKTDANGQYRVSIPEGVEPMLVSARLEGHGLSGDVALAGFYDWGSHFPYDYRDNSYYLPEGQPFLTYVYTERPIYRPGQAVQFKAVIRKDNDVRYSLPKEGTPVKVRVLDARGNAIENMELLTNSFGTINGTFHISEGAMLGEYQIETGVNETVSSQTFQVEDYRKPDYQIKVASLQPEKEDMFVRGEEVNVKVSAAYYFGEPLANAKLDVHFYHSWLLESNVSRSLKTDENGDATISFSAPYDLNYDSYSWSNSPKVQRVRMEVTANDGSNQTVTGVYYFSVYSASEQLKLETEGYYVNPGQSFSVTARVMDLFNQPVVGRGLTLTTSSWNRTSYEFNKADQELQLESNEQGITRQDLRLSAGYHELTLKGEDPQGHAVEVKRWVYVFSSKQDWFERSRDRAITISAEKDSYKPYETAQFAIESSFSGPALLTFERGSVINTRMIELTAPLTLVEAEVIPEHAPNVYVTVNAWQAGSRNVDRYGYSYYSYTTQADSYLRLAKTQIQVDSSTKALNINIATDKQIYAPGETLSAVIEVKDAAGKPVPAELSLAVVDEAIYGLASDFAGDIFEAFYGPRAHTVNTFDSMAPYRVIMEGGRGGGGDEGIPPAARSEFPDTSAWLPIITTDENGKATVTIDLPDNTTSWRLSVKAVTRNHQVGQALTNIETTKDVFVRPVLPRVLTSGDQATLTAFVHNYSAQTQTLAVHLSAPGLQIRSQNDQVISLKAGEVLPVGWQVRVQSAKPTQVTISAKSGADVLDSIILPLALQPAAVQDVQNQSGQFRGTLTLALPLPNVERETSGVRLTLNRSMSGTLLNGLEYLTGYPYGCVEQTMSRALPNAVVAHAAEQLGIGGPDMQVRLEPLIKASIQRLYGLQHSDGGWGWWTDDVSDPYQTAWVLFGLGLMNDSGHSIEPRVMEQAARWLNGKMENRGQLDIRTRAYALYSMAQAGQGDLEKTLELVDASIHELDPFNQAALALALDQLGEKEQAQAILDLLTQSAVKENEFVYWPQPSYDGEYHSKTMASTTRTTALVLLAYAKIQPENPRVPGIVKYLADQRQGIYGWGTTNETSFTILALTEYLIQEEMQSGSTPFEVLVNNKSLAFGTLEVGNSSASIEIPLGELKSGLNSLLVTTEGDKPIYFDLSTRYDLLRSEVEAAGNVQVTRRYLDPKTKAPIENFTAGQLVKVEVKVQVPDNTSFVAVEDYLPGGLEAINEGLSATNQVSMGYWGYENYRPFFWEDYGYNYKEIRGDRVVFFITTLEKGSRTFTYYARVTTPGQFVALPAQAYAMYDMSLWGRSESTSIQIGK